MLGKAFKDLKSGLAMRHVWLHQAYHELTVKYKRTILGSLWVSGSMAFTSVAVAIVFGGLFGQSLQEALPYIMAGNMAAGLAFYIISDATELYVGASSIIRNHAYPYTYYAFESVTRVFFLFLHNLVVYYIAMAIVGALAVPHWSLILGLPIILLIMVVWGMLTGMVAARFRDLRFLLPYISQLMFFLTPIYWHAENLRGWRSYIAYGNPFYGLVEIVRAPLMGKAAIAHNWYVSLSVLGVGILLWLIFFSAFRRRIPFWV